LFKKDEKPIIVSDFPYTEVHIRHFSGSCRILPPKLRLPKLVSLATPAIQPTHFNIKTRYCTQTESPLTMISLCIVHILFLHASESV